jgi:cytochrome bd ubiquinol oxidase subunit II
MSALQITWFWLIALLLTVYAVLDGFDLGAGFWYLFTNRDAERKNILSAIGPHWDGNEVWLLTGGGAIFAAFPSVYATVFSGFYLALIIVIAALIFRAVAIEFRNKSDSPRWRKCFDVAFALGSTLPPLLFGVAIGNIMQGIPMNAAGNYTGGFFDLLNPLAIFTGCLTLFIFAHHGALYLVMKTKDALSLKCTVWAQRSAILCILFLVVILSYLAIGRPDVLTNFNRTPLLWAFPTLALLSLFSSLRKMAIAKAGHAFIASVVTIVSLMLSFTTLLFPKMVPSSNNPALSLTIMNASSSPLTLKVMLIMALIGMPLVIGYTIWIYWTFRGQVSAEEYY